MDWNDSQRTPTIAERHFQQQTAQPVLYELVQRTSKGDQRDSWVEETIISIHATEAGAYKAGLKPNFVVRPLKVKD